MVGHWEKQGTLKRVTTGEATMPVCCRCNGSGRCKACSCVKSGRSCVDCLPSRNGHCSNHGMHTSAVDPSVQLSFSLSSLDAPRTDGTNTCSATHVPTQTKDLPAMSTITESHYPRAIIDDIIMETSIATMECELPHEFFLCSSLCHASVVHGETCQVTSFQWLLIEPTVR